MYATPLTYCPLMGLMVVRQYRAKGELTDILLFSVLVYELVGSAMTKNALMKAGDI